VFKLKFTNQPCTQLPFFFFQVDKRHHTPAGASVSSISHRLLLIGFMKEIKAKFSWWTQEQCFKGKKKNYNYRSQATDATCFKN